MFSQRTWCTNRLLWHTNSDFYGIRSPDFYATWAVFIEGGCGLQYVDTCWNNRSLAIDTLNLVVHTRLCAPLFFFLNVTWWDFWAGGDVSPQRNIKLPPPPCRHPRGTCAPPPPPVPPPRIPPPPLFSITIRPPATCSDPSSLFLGVCPPVL